MAYIILLINKKFKNLYRLYILYTKHLNSLVYIINY